MNSFEMQNELNMRKSISLIFIIYELENSGKDEIIQVWVDGESFSVKSAN